MDISQKKLSEFKAITANRIYSRERRKGSVERLYEPETSGDD